MALNALTLSTTQGVQGRPFQAAISGLTTGKVEVLGDASPGFSVVNGNLMSQGLPYPVSTVALREYEPGVGVGYRDTRIEIVAASQASLMAQALAAIGVGRKLARYRVAGTRQPDGSIAYSVVVEDDLGATAVQPAGSVTPTPPPPVPGIGTLINGFEVAGEWSGIGTYIFAQDSTAAVQGNSALRVGYPAGGSGNTVVQRVFNGTDAANLGTIAVYTQLDTDYDWQTDASVTVSILLNGGGTVYPIASRTSLALANPRAAVKTGGIWTSGKVSQQAVIDAGVGNHAFRVATTPLSSGPQCGSRAHDALYRNVGGKASILLRFDDGYTDAIDAQGILDGIFGTSKAFGECFPAINLVGGTNRMTYAQMKSLEDAGWTISLDGDPDDNSIVDTGTVAGAVSKMAAQRAELVNRGFKKPNSFVYPFGAIRKNGTTVEKTSADLSGNTITPTDGATTGIVAGMRVIARDVGRMCRVQSVTSTVVTLTENVVTAGTGKRVRFVDDSAEYHGNKLQNALRADGWKWGLSTEPGVMFVQYGISPDDAIVMPCTGTTNITLSTFQTAVQTAIDGKAVICFYLHRIQPRASGVSSNWPREDFIDAMNWLKTQVDAGAIEFVTTATLDAKYGRATVPA